ncbi:MAG: peptide chain release factor N(5)-glutamine methyltransferase [Pseudomonadota bacterium]
MDNRINSCIKLATQELSPSSDTAALDSEILLLYALNQIPYGKSYARSFLRTWPEYQLKSDQFVLFKQSIKQRLKGKPIAYITGYKEFWSLDLQVNEHTLIPRPDTEVLVEQALELIPQTAQWNILDLGTGSGAIALAIASERKNCQLFASDQSLAAIQMAKQNASRLNIKNCQFFCANWLAAITKNKFQMIVSNPPYIKPDDAHLKQAELSYEPISALHSEANGLADIEQIIQQTADKLTPPAYILLEHGYDQADQVKQLLLKNHFHNHSQARDYNGILRVTIGNI